MNWVKTSSLRLFLSFALVVASMAVGGCAAFPQHRLSDVSLVPQLQGDKMPVVTYAFSSGKRGRLEGEVDFPKRIQRQMGEEFVEVLKESGCFANVSRGGTGGMTVRARVTCSYGSNGGFWMWTWLYVSGNTVMVIPFWEKVGYELKATVVAAGGTQKDYLLDDAMTEVLWLPFAVTYPFWNWNKVEKEVRQNMYRHLLLRMQEDGLLPKSRVLN